MQETFEQYQAREERDRAVRGKILHDLPFKLFNLANIESYTKDELISANNLMFERLRLLSEHELSFLHKLLSDRLVELLKYPDDKTSSILNFKNYLAYQHLDLANKFLDLNVGFEAGFDCLKKSILRLKSEDICMFDIQVTGETLDRFLVALPLGNNKNSYSQYKNACRSRNWDTREKS